MPRVGLKRGVFDQLSRTSPAPGVRNAFFMDLPALAGVFLRRPLRSLPRSARLNYCPWTLLSNEVLDLTFTVVLSELRHFLVFVENRRKEENESDFKAIEFLKFGYMLQDFF